MSTSTTRPSTFRDLDSLEQRLARVLDSPALVRIVPLLPAEALHRIIHTRGLEACGELVLAATPAQLTALLDLDLWRAARPGLDERLDVERFGEWLEVLVETGDDAAARVVAALDGDLVVAGLSRYVRVFDPGIFEPVAQSDDEAVSRHEAMRAGDWLDVGAAKHDAAMGQRLRPPDDAAATLECEVGGYLVRARRSDAWEAIVTLLVALDTAYPDAFHALMRGCRRVSNSRPEVDGLDDLLHLPEQHVHDVEVERGRRRAQHGYATPADARAFLALARQPPKPVGGSGRHDASGVASIVAAYFRAADDGAEERTAGRARLSLAASPDPVGSAHHDAQADADALIDVLADAGVIPGHVALLGAASADPAAARLGPLRQLMAYVRDHDEAAFVARSRELGFLANVLLAGSSVMGRPFTPPEASDAAACTCALGLDAWPAGPVTEHFLRTHDLTALFTAGWSHLHHEVSLYAVDRLLATLDDVRGTDVDTRRELAGLRRTLLRYRDAGTPWLARNAADVLGELDLTAWAAVRGLLSECPVLPAALSAVLDGRTTTVSQTAFDFIATRDQIAGVRTFLRRLPDLLAR